MITASSGIAPAISDPAIGAVSNDGEHARDAVLARVFSDWVTDFRPVHLV